MGKMFIFLDFLSFFGIALLMKCNPSLKQQLIFFQALLGKHTTEAVAKTMRKQNFKIQILAGNPVNSRFSASSQISLTLVSSRCSIVLIILAAFWLEQNLDMGFVIFDA